jgi:hypothetical protein
MACLYTGDDTRLGLPNWDTLELIGGHRMGGGEPDHAQKLRLDGGPTARAERSGVRVAGRISAGGRMGKSILLYRID